MPNTPTDPGSMNVFLDKFKEFMTTQDANSSSVTPEGTPPLSPSSWGEDDELSSSLSSQNEEEATPPVVPTPPAPEKSYYDKIGDVIQQDPKLTASWNKWFSENIMGVQQSAPITPTAAAHPTVNQAEVIQQWQQAYEQDPVGTTALLVQKQLEMKETAMQNQFQAKLQPLMQFTTQLAKNNFEATVSNHPEWKEAKPLFDYAVSQVSSEQLQQNPQILDVIYNSVVGQLYRTGKLAGMTKKSEAPTLSPIPGSNQPLQSNAIGQLSKEEQFMLKKYGVTAEDYKKYGGA